MATKKKAAQSSELRFDTTERFAAWIEQEGMTELLPLALTPKPSAILPKGATAALRIGWVDPEDDDFLFPFALTASGVEEWSIEGAHRKTELLAFDVEHYEQRQKQGIALRLRVPGVLTLRCATLSVRREKRRRRPVVIAPSSTELLVWGEKEVSPAQLLALIEPPAGLTLYRETKEIGHPPVRHLLDPKVASQVPVRPFFEKLPVARSLEEGWWIRFEWMLSIGAIGHYVTFRRGSCSDAEWARVQRAPSLLEPCTVQSGTLRCSGSDLLGWL